MVKSVPIMVCVDGIKSKRHLAVFVMIAILALHAILNVLVGVEKLGVACKYKGLAMLPVPKIRVSRFPLLSHSHILCSMHPLFYRIT